MEYITAHLSKIHDLDWSRSIGTKLATCSNDATVKVNYMSRPVVEERLGGVFY